MSNFFSFENDKNALENKIAPGKSFIFLFKYFLIIFISLFNKLVPLDNLLFEDKGKDFTFIPSYNAFI